MSEASGGTSGAGGNGEEVAVEARFRVAVARHRTGELAEAQGLYEGILQEQPGHAEALHMLGLLAHEQGRNEDAERLIAEAIANNDKNAFYHHNLGEIRRILGKAEEAAACYRAATALEPSYAQAHNSLGMVLFQLGEPDEAVKEFETAIGIDSADAGMHNNLGVALQAKGRLQEAIESFRRSLDVDPGRVEVRNNLGAALRANGDLDEAERHLHEAAEADPSVANVHYNLARLYLDQGNPDASEAAARKAIELNPRQAQHFIALGEAQRAMGDPEESLNSLHGAIALEPRNAVARNELGVSLLILGRFEEAEASFRRAVNIEPRFAIAHGNLARVRHFDDSDRNQVEVLEKLASSPNLSDEDLAHMHFALGKMLDDIGEYERAMQHFVSGNALEHARTHFDAAAGRAFVERSRATFSDAFVEEKCALGSPSDMPIFVVGMMRSGTTLIEQILASHPAVYAGGELEFFRGVSAQLPERLGGGRPYPECVSALDAATVDSICNTYLEHLRERMGDARRFTDKNPLNFEHLGLIMVAFPNARVIHCRRDPMDLALSIFFQHFSKRHEFAYSFADIAECHRQYEQLMAHWHAVFPGRILDVRYEDLVADLETTIRSMLDYLDLQWDERCLAFHRTERPVGTASLWQVRQPLYGYAIERWRHYEPYLEELRAALGEQ
jgi:tetratricopeptide (TPR) repeat protein